MLQEFNTSLFVKNNITAYSSVSANNLVVNLSLENLSTNGSNENDIITIIDGKCTNASNISNTGVYENTEVINFNNNIIENSQNTANVKVTFTQQNVNTNPISVAAGWFSSFISTVDNIYSVGSTNNLALGSVVWKQYPTPVNSQKLIDIAVGGRFIGSNNFCLALNENHKMVSWGDDKYGQLGRSGAPTNTLKIQTVPTAIIGPTQNKTWASIAAGERHSVAIDTSGYLYMWGANDSGQIFNLPLKVTTPTPPLPIGTTINFNVKQWKHVACGKLHTAAIDLNNQLFLWGDNTSGQLGNSDVDQIYTLVQPYTNKSWESVSCGGSFTAAIDTDGYLYTWGDNTYGQLGINNTFIKNTVTPQRLSGIFASKRWSKVSCGSRHIAAIDTDGLVYCWGDNTDNQLSLSSESIKSSSVPIQLISELQLQKWSDVSCGFAHTILQSLDDKIFTIGNAYNTQTKEVKSHICAQQQLFENVYNYNGLSIECIAVGRYILTLINSLKTQARNNLVDIVAISDDVDFIESKGIILTEKSILLIFNVNNQPFTPKQATITIYGNV